MKTSFELDGYWWLPDNPGQRIAGVLRYTENGELSLKLFDDFTSMADFLTAYSHSTLHPPSLIHGEDGDANRITLLVRSHGARRWNLSSTFPIVHYHIQHCLKGVWLTSATDTLFLRTEIALSLFSSWVNKYPLRSSLFFNEHHQITRIELNYPVESDREVFALADGYSLSLEPTISFSGNPHQEEITLQQKYIASITHTAPYSFATILEKCYRLKSFLNMATLRHSYFISLKLYGKEHLPASTGDTPLHLPIDLYITQSDLSSEASPTHPQQYLFTYPVIQHVFPALIRKWFSFDQSMMPIIYHLMENIREKTRFSSADFLIVIQALEGYHRRFFDPESTQKKTLETRLTDLKNHFSSQIMAVTEIDTTAAVASRHYYSHFYKKKADQPIAEGEALYLLTKHFQRLLICCLLHELGIDNTTINDILQKHISYV